MKLSKFRFNLPEGLIALYPTPERDESRLMVVHRDSGKIEHAQFKDLLNYLEEGSSLVLNDTRVYPARLQGNKEQNGARIEVTLLRELDEKSHLWSVEVDPARKIRVGNKIYFGEDEVLEAEVLDNTTSRGRTVAFHFTGSREEFFEIIERLGSMPLPDKISRPPAPEDAERYQTVYAKKLGAVTAPSAGFHFTPHLVKRLEIKGVKVSELTLHMGMSNCQDVDMEDLSKFRMPSENFSIPQSTAEAVNDSLSENKRVVAVGVSTAKAIESNLTVDGMLRSVQDGWTDKFIFPPYAFRACQGLVTNFHLPLSTMLMLACAFGGYELIMKAYAIAIKERYRFFNYGDAMLIL